MKINIPQEIKSCLWSYNFDDIDIKKDKNIVISQVLNYGNWDAVKWLFKTYSKKEIKNVLQHPQRGIWFKEVLNFWSSLFNIKISRLTKLKSILNIKPVK